MGGLHEADAVQEFEVALLHGHDAVGDALAQKLFKPQGHARRGLARAEDEDAPIAGEVVLEGLRFRGDAQSVSVEGQHALHHLQGVDSVESGAEDPLGVEKGIDHGAILLGRRHFRTSGFRMVGGFVPASMASMFSATSRAMLSRVECVAEPMWGSRTVLGQSLSPSATRGSIS
ncbi:hypothetical protein DSECCO2_434310 [anaerobic digester metagenome]